MFDPSQQNTQPFIPHLHLEDILELVPPEDREQRLDQVNQILEFYSRNDLVSISVDEDGNFYYYLTSKGIKYAGQQHKNLY